MYYPDLRSLADVDALPMPEFNLRAHCVIERIKWERGIPDQPREEEFDPATMKGSLADIIAEIKKERDATTR